jgi:cell division protein FtsB
MTFDELYELYVTATNEIATLKDENKALEKEVIRLQENKHGETT